MTETARRGAASEEGGPAEEEDMPMLTKVAILFVALGQEATGEVLKYLNDYEVEELTQAIANLKNVTVFEALESIREVYGYDYTLDGTRIYVQQPELQTRLYQVNYIIGQRRGVSDLQVIGGASVGSQSGTSGTSGTSGGTTGGTGGTSTSAQFSSVQASF